MGSINPNSDQIGAMLAAPHERGPIHMINLLRFAERAHYPDDHAAARENLSGREAYQRYSDAVMAHLKAVGARPVWLGTPDLVAIGPAEESWDAAFVIEYPSVGAMLGMISNPEYQLIAIHRTAALADSRLIRCTPTAAFTI